MRSLISLIFMLSSLGNAHDGVDHGDGDHKPSSIENGKLLGKDKITYLDAGADIQWAGQKLKRQITNTNQVIYQYSGEVKEETKTSAAFSNYYDLKISGGEILKSFSFDHAGESNAVLEMLSPDFSRLVEISKLHEFKLNWKAELKTSPPASMIKIIIEVMSASKSLQGRLTVSTNDDGEFSIPVELLSQLPEGSAKIAVKRIWLGEFQPFSGKNEMLGVKTVVSVVGTAKVVAD